MFIGQRLDKRNIWAARGLHQMWMLLLCMYLCCSKQYSAIFFARILKFCLGFNKILRCVRELFCALKVVHSCCYCLYDVWYELLSNILHFQILLVPVTCCAFLWMILCLKKVKIMLLTYRLFYGGQYIQTLATFERIRGRPYPSTQNIAVKSLEFWCGRRPYFFFDLEHRKLLYGRKKRANVGESRAIYVLSFV